MNLGIKQEVYLLTKRKVPIHSLTVELNLLTID